MPETLLGIIAMKQRERVSDLTMRKKDMQHIISTEYGKYHDRGIEVFVEHKAEDLK